MAGQRGHGFTGKEREGAGTCAGYLTAKAPYLGCATALERGWPIATGIVEGACRYIAADRNPPVAGMRDACECWNVPALAG